MLPLYHSNFYNHKVTIMYIFTHNSPCFFLPNNLLSMITLYWNTPKFQASYFLSRKFRNILFSHFSPRAVHTYILQTQFYRRCDTVLTLLTVRTSWICNTFSCMFLVRLCWFSFVRWWSCYIFLVRLCPSNSSIFVLLI